MGWVTRVVPIALVLACARADADRAPRSSCHGALCCEAWIANAVVHDEVVGARIGDTYDDVADGVAHDEELARTYLCPMFHDDAACAAVYEAPTCRDAQAVSHGGSRVWSPIPRYDAIATVSQQRLEGFGAAYDLPGCNPFALASEAIAALDQEVAACARLLEAQLVLCPEGTRSLFCELPRPAVTQDPRTLWTGGGEFQGLAADQEEHARAAADDARCRALANRLRDLQLVEASVLTLARASSVSHLGQGGLLFGGVGTPTGAASPDTYEVVFVKPADDCRDVAIAPATITETIDEDRGRIIRISGQVGDVSDTIELVEPHADTDGDGVPDRRDDCPTEPGAAKWRGCGDPDPDKDKVLRAADSCPTVKGPASSQGCPDKDKDTIPDRDDRCPKTKGDPAFAGCPPDHDGDGVIDQKDKCPDVAGEAKRKGCPHPDPDGDGVQGAKDACPDTAGDKDLDGCPPGDADGDGVIDKNDQCPDVAGEAARKGCPDPDPDGDGVEGSSDRCPDVAGASAGGGCPDSDGDGVVDLDDACPQELGDAAHQGCPAATTPPPSDRDQDGVIDANDACPDQAGDRSDGCASVVATADRDQDTVADDVDTCPDFPGPAATAGCDPGCMDSYAQYFGKTAEASAASCGASDAKCLCAAMYFDYCALDYGLTLRDSRATAKTWDGYQRQWDKDGKAGGGTDANADLTAAYTALSALGGQCF